MERAVTPSVVDLPPTEQIRRYRSLAAEAADLAARVAQPDTCIAYRRIAAHWQELAADLERIQADSPIGGEAGATVRENGVQGQSREAGPEDGRMGGPEAAASR